MNPRVRIKICGITNLEVAQAAVHAGADALGFVFYEKSPRYITLEQAHTIIQQLPPFVSKVGLFVNASAAEIRAVLDRVPIDILQFHGQESEADCQQWNKPYIKAMGVRSPEHLAAELCRYPSAAALLLDAYAEVLMGGTGQAFNWHWFPSGVRQPLILAGGLTPENVVEGILQTRPYAVDVSSGVESHRGVKDIARIQSFIKNVRTACHSKKE